MNERILVAATTLFMEQGFGRTADVAGDAFQDATSPLDRAFVLRVTTLLRELIFKAFDTVLGAEHKELVAWLILKELTQAPDAPTFLPLPTSELGLRVS